MIKLGDGFEIERDNRQWWLTEMRPAKRGGKLVRHKSYHSTLEQVIGMVIDKSAGKCESLEELLALLKNAKEVLTAEVTNLALNQAAAKQKR